jgi:hypothetical protein
MEGKDFKAKALRWAGLVLTIGVGVAIATYGIRFVDKKMAAKKAAPAPVAK